MSVDRFEELLSRHLDGALDVHDRQQLAGLLGDDPARLEELGRCERLDRELTALHRGPPSDERMVAAVLAGLRGCAPSATVRLMSRLRHSARRRRGLRLALAALVLLGLGSAGFWLLSPATPVGWTTVADADDRLLRSGIALPLAPQTRLQVGDELLAGENGLTLQLGASSELRLAAACRLRLEMATRAELLDGRLAASVQRGGAGLRIASRLGSAVVTGTRFDLSLDAERLQLTVQEGVVVLQRGGEELRVGAGGTARATTAGPLQRRLVFSQGSAGYRGCQDVVISTQDQRWTHDNGRTRLDEAQLLLTVQEEYRTRALLRFADLALPPGTSLHGAELELHVESWQGPLTVHGRYLQSPWESDLAAQGGLGWRWRGSGRAWQEPGGDLGGAAVDAVLHGEGEQLLRIPLDPADVSRWLTGPSSNHGLALEIRRQGAVLRIDASEHADPERRPRLVLYLTGDGD